jgi:hypothetical protein
MHLVCLGVVSKLLVLWVNTSSRVFRLRGHQVAAISEKLLYLSQFIPSEFSRKPRSLDELKRWKATELRQFLLYTGPIALAQNIPQSHFTLLLSLHFAIWILTSREFCSSHVGYASTILKYFVTTFETLFGFKYCSYNVHGFLHLTQDTEPFGTLDSFSAFRFENHLGQIKRLLSGSVNPFSQIHRRLVERKLVSDINSGKTLP